MERRPRQPHCRVGEVRRAVRALVVAAAERVHSGQRRIRAHPMNRLTLARIGVLLVLVALLEVGCRSGLINNFDLIPPSQMVVALFELLRSGSLNGAIVRTIGAVAIAVVLAIVAGLLIAIMLHALPRLRRAIDPVLATYY